MPCDCGSSDGVGFMSSRMQRHPLLWKWTQMKLANEVSCLWQIQYMIQSHSEEGTAWSHQQGSRLMTSGVRAPRTWLSDLSCVLSALWLSQSNWSKPRWSIWRRQHSGVRQIHTNEQLSLSHLWLIWVLTSKGWKEEAQQQRDGPPSCWTPSSSVARQTLSLVGASIPGTWFLWRHTPCRAFYHFSSASLLTWAAGPVNLGGETMWGGGRWQSS